MIYQLVIPADYNYHSDNSARIPRALSVIDETMGEKIKYSLIKSCKITGVGGSGT